MIQSQPKNSQSLVTRLKPVLANRDAASEQGSCGIRKKLLTGGEQRHFAVSQVVIQNARPHFHRSTWELYIVQKGNGLLELDGVPFEISEGDVIDADQLPLVLPIEAEPPTTDFPESLDVDVLETWAIRKSLVKTNGNVSQAARLLGISERTLRNKLNSPTAA